jgi:hypothetical protein
MLRLAHQPRLRGHRHGCLTKALLGFDGNLLCGGASFTRMLRCLSCVHACDHSY